MHDTVGEAISLPSSNSLKVRKYPANSYHFQHFIIYFTAQKTKAGGRLIASPTGVELKSNLPTILTERTKIVSGSAESDSALRMLNERTISHPLSFSFPNCRLEELI